MLGSSFLFVLSLTCAAPSDPFDRLATLAGGVWEARVEAPGQPTLFYSETFELELGGKFLLARQTISTLDGKILRTTLGVMGREPNTGDFCSWIFLSDGGTAKACAPRLEANGVWIFEGEASPGGGPARRLRTHFSLPAEDLLVNEVFFFDAATAAWSPPTTLTFRRRR